MTWHTSTVELAELIEEEFLNHGAGTLDVQIDDIIERYRAQLDKTISLYEASVVIHQRLKTALKYLWDVRGWHHVPATRFFFTTFANGKPRHLGDAETTEDEIVRSVAGIGGARGRTVGLHFFVGKDDFMFVWHNAHGTRNGYGKVRANVDRAVDLAGAGQLTIAAADAITARVGSHARPLNARLKELRVLASGKSSS